MLTPIELQNKQLKTGRGYARKDADEFLAEVYADYETLYKQNLEFKDKIATLSEGVQYYKSIETTLQKALVLAEKTAKETVDAAKLKASTIEQEAEQKAQAIEQEASQKVVGIEKESREKRDAILRDARQKADALERESNEEHERITNYAAREWDEARKKCIAIIQQYNSFKAQFKKLASSQLEMLDEDYFEIYTTNLKTLLSESSKSLTTSREEVAETVQPVDDVMEEVGEVAGAVPPVSDDVMETEVEEGKDEVGVATPVADDVATAEEAMEDVVPPTGDDAEDAALSIDGDVTQEAEDAALSVGDDVTQEAEDAALSIDGDVTEEAEDAALSVDDDVTEEADAAAPISGYAQPDGETAVTGEVSTSTAFTLVGGDEEPMASSGGDVERAAAPTFPEAPNWDDDSEDANAEDADSSVSGWSVKGVEPSLQEGMGIREEDFEGVMSMGDQGSDTMSGWSGMEESQAAPVGPSEAEGSVAANHFERFGAGDLEQGYMSAEMQEIARKNEEKENALASLIKEFRRDLSAEGESKEEEGTFEFLDSEE